MPRRADLPKNLARAWDAIGQGAPELLDDLDFARMRQKRAAPKKQVEREHVQRPLIVWLRRHLPAGSVVFAVTNHARSKQQIFALMRDGMLPGVPDICCLTPGPRTLFIECKKPKGGRLSDNQTHVQSQLTALQIPVLSECRSVEQAAAWLRELGVL